MFGIFKKTKVSDHQYNQKPNWQVAYETKNKDTKINAELQKPIDINGLETVEQKLKAANQLKSNIDTIDHFLMAAERTWTGILSSAAYGTWESRSIGLDTDLKNEMLDILRKRRAEYVQEIQEIMEFKKNNNE